MHLHGHDFYLLAQGIGAYNSSSVTLVTKNPPRRDVAMLPSSGYMVIGYQANNPGAWLLHCHVGWHKGEGLALQVVERYSEIATLIDYDTLNSTCSAWNTYATANSIIENDSGV